MQQQDEKSPGEDGVQQDQSFREASTTVNLERNEESWQASFRKLQQFKKDNGHVTTAAEMPYEPEIVELASRQRCQCIE